MLWGIFMESADRQANSGLIAGVIGMVTGLPSMTWAAIQGDWLPAYAGSATGIGGVIYFIFKQGEDRRIKMMADAMAAMVAEISGLRGELKLVRETAEESEIKAIADRTALRIENGKLREQLALVGIGVSKVGAGVKRVEDIVTNPATTPDPDAAKGAA